MSAATVPAGVAPPAADTRKTLFQLSMPLLLNALLGLAVTLIDTMIISAYSENAAAAVSLANQILLVAYDLSALFGIGGVVMIARHLGRGDEAAARVAAETAVSANAAISILIAIVLGVAAPWLVAAINCPPEIANDAVLYVRVVAVAIVFNGVMMAATACLRGFGRTRIILVLGSFAYVLYLVAEYLLVFGLGPLPALGVLGSALATLLVRVVAVAALLFVLVRELGLSFQLRRRLAELRATAATLFSLSYPSAVDNIAYACYQMILVSFIARLDVATVLSRSFTLALSAFLTVILMALTQGTEVMVGYRYGAARLREVYDCALRSAAVAAAITTACSVLLYLCAEPLIGLFTQVPKIHALAKELLFLTIFVQPFSALNTVLFHSLKAIGDVRMPVIVTQIMMWGTSLPLAYVLAVRLDLGVVGLWYVLLFEEALKALYLLLRWSARFRAVSGRPVLQAS